MKKYMNDMSDKELDDFFKQAAQQHSVPFDPADWQKMKGRLDRNGYTDNWKRWMGRGLYLIAFLFLFSGTSQINQFEISENHVGLHAGEHQRNDASASSEASEATTAQEEKGLSDATSNEQKTLSSSSALKETEVKKEKSGADPEENNNKEDNSVNSAYVSAPQQEAEFVEGEEDREVTNYEAGFIYPDRLAFLNYLPLQYISKSGGLPPVEKVAIYVINDTAKQSPEEVIQNKKKHPLFSFSVMLAPDISAVKVKEVKGVGRAAGINLEYFLLPNLSINAGAIYAYKTYEVGESSAGSYGYGGSSGYRKLKSIDGNCRVLDIPINLRYYAFNLQKSRWYVSSGVTSYLMLTEDYEYNYDRYTPDNYRFYNYRNENQHYFKVLNLSVGYERRLGNHWAMQLEPYTKVPLSGVGAGKIKLNTTGVFISLKYVL